MYYYGIHQSVDLMMLTSSSTLTVAYLKMHCQNNYTSTFFM